MRSESSPDLPALRELGGVALPATPLSIQSNAFRIPPRTRELLFVSNGDPGLARDGLGITITLNLNGGDPQVTSLAPSEPSTIYTRLPVRRPPDPSSVPRPPYYPSYVALTPEQRWVYLSWLGDVSQSVNLGFVFLYYYGLERHLLTGQFEAAFDEILLLRHHHAQGSFPIYSKSALMHSCLARKRPDLLRRLYLEEQVFAVGNAELRLLHEIGVNLSARALVELGYQIDGVNRRYLRDHRPAYEEVLEGILTERYGQPELPFGGRFNIPDVPSRPDLLFANISFPDSVRTPSLPDFLHHRPFRDEVQDLFAATHEKVKAELRSAKQRSRPRRLAPPDRTEKSP